MSVSERGKLCRVDLKTSRDTPLAIGFHMIEIILGFFYWRNYLFIVSTESNHANTLGDTLSTVCSTCLLGCQYYDLVIAMLFMAQC